MRVGEAEGGAEESFGGGAVGGVAAIYVRVFFPDGGMEGRGGGYETYMVKQSYIKLNAAGPTTVLTSSGIGGAWLREPSL